MAMPMLVPMLASIAVKIERLGDRADDPQRERDRAFVLAGAAFLDDGELVAAEARQHVGFAKRGLQALADLDQQFIAGGMAERVVDGLEAVEIEHHDGDGAAAALQPLARFIELRVELARDWPVPSGRRAAPGG